MKAQAEAVDLIGIAAVVVVIVLIAGVFERDTIFEALRQVATYTGRAVARDISSMLTISAAAPVNITMKYYQNAKYTYAVGVKGNTVYVTVTGGNLGQDVKGQAETLITPQNSIDIKDCNQFSISKIGGKYDISCYQLTQVQ
jgi:hypothetical protein